MKPVGRSSVHPAAGRPRSPRTAPSARRGRAAWSPRCHGSGSSSRTAAPSGVASSRLRTSWGSPSLGGRVAGADSSPRTFSMTTHSGCSASMASAMCAHRPERVPGARLARLPTVGSSPLWWCSGWILRWGCQALSSRAVSVSVPTSLPVSSTGVRRQRARTSRPR